MIGLSFRSAGEFQGACLLLYRVMPTINFLGGILEWLLFGVFDGLLE
jgi:hypothetical protein